ncbi:MAG: aspartate aminotransferase family protein [Flavobacteriales bacterium]|nr:aspartate aminotransferase family protein [Flavobacteriales bacterium]MCB9447615.1 aspartate aminotransferase family protein [Flavobacteriales bacterium]
MYWEAYSHSKIRDRVFQALNQNLDFRQRDVLGLPASFLDPEEFYPDAPFLDDAPYMRALNSNPNHIGCHTVTQSEEAFKGTQELEREAIALCAEEILGGESGQQDGYVAAGGTEANIMALWIYRNYYMEKHSARPDEIAVVYSQDSHYSMPKGCNLLCLKQLVMEVDDSTRLIKTDALKQQLGDAAKSGIKYLIVVMNMSTTMFGSVDPIDEVTAVLDAQPLPFMLHVDGAFGGFIYPFSSGDERYTFKNPHITSFTMDAHKMLQAPYGTGIFLIRKGWMQYAMTKEARYVHGNDYTLSGSRSGANAIAIWMILRTHGSDGWKSKVRKLIARTDRLCETLDKKGIAYYRHPHMNIVTIRGNAISHKVAEKFVLVPDTHEGEPNWWKIVVMDHVTQGMLDRFLASVH